MSLASVGKGQRIRDKGHMARNTRFDDEFLSAEFVQRLKRLWEGEPPGEPKSSLTIRQSLIAIRCYSGSAGASPSHDFAD